MARRKSQVQVTLRCALALSPSGTMIPDAHRSLMPDPAYSINGAVSLRERPGVRQVCGGRCGGPLARPSFPLPHHWRERMKVRAPISLTAARTQGETRASRTMNPHPHPLPQALRERDKRGSATSSTYTQSDRAAVGSAKRCAWTAQFRAENSGDLLAAPHRLPADDGLRRSRHAGRADLTGSRSSKS